MTASIGSGGGAMGTYFIPITVHGLTRCVLTDDVVVVTAAGRVIARGRGDQWPKRLIVSSRRNPVLAAGFSNPCVLHHPLKPRVVSELVVGGEVAGPERVLPGWVEKCPARTPITVLRRR